MKKRWPVIVAYAIAVALQLALLVGAWELHVLSRQKMMVMRYLVAKNLELEAFWFSPSAMLVQTAVFLAVALGLAGWAFVLARRASRAAFAHALIGAGLAAVGACLIGTVSASEVRALYAIVAAVWAVLAVQGAVIVVAAVLRARAGRGDALSDRAQRR